MYHHIAGLLLVPPVDEEMRLKDLAERHGEHDWMAISQELGSGRSPIACFKKYMRDLQRLVAPKGAFTEEEDRRLQQLIEIYGIGDLVDWEAVAAGMSTEDRLYTRDQCHCYWRKHCSLNPGSNWKKKWTVEDEWCALRCGDPPRTHRGCAGCTAVPRWTGHPAHHVGEFQKDVRGFLFSVVSQRLCSNAC